MIYEISNPSDALTCKGNDFVITVAAIYLLGNGNYGITNEKESSPIMFGWENWFEKKGIKDLSKFIEKNKKEIATVLNSVMLGSIHERNDLDAMLKLIPEDKKQQWIADRNDRRRSSLNDIETIAHKYAQKLLSK